jgi:chaperonin cofactor prefoldin
VFNFLSGKVVLAGLSANEFIHQPVQLLLPAPRSEENQLKDFHEGLQKLNAAIQRGSKTKAQLNDFQKQGSWDSFWGGLSGKNDKGLANLLTEFGASLEVTQSVLQLVTQVHTVNNNVLRGFNDALVREIERLQADTQTLEGNQNGALVVLYEFKHQIDELLALADGYEYCKHAVSQLAAAQNSHETGLHQLNLAFSNGTQVQEQLNETTARQLIQQREDQGAQQKQIERVTKLLGSEIQARKRLSTEMAASLKQVSEKLDQHLERVESKLGSLHENQQRTQARIEQMEAQLLAKSSWLREQAVALVAIVLAGAALASIFAL